MPLEGKLLSVHRVSPNPDRSRSEFVVDLLSATLKSKVDHYLVRVRYVSRRIQIIEKSISCLWSGYYIRMKKIHCEYQDYDSDTDLRIFDLINSSMSLKYMIHGPKFFLSGLL